MNLGEFCQMRVKWSTEFIFRETVQLHRLRDLICLAANDDWY